MSVTIVTTVIRCAVAVEVTISQLREIVDGITANVNDNIYILRKIKHVSAFREVEDKDIILSIEASRSRSLNLEPSAAASCVQDCIRIGLCLSVCTVCAGNHSCLSLTKADGYTFNDVIRLRAEFVSVTVNVGNRCNFKITTESIQNIEIELSGNNQLRKTSLTRSCIACCEGEITKCGVASYCKSTCGVMTLTATNFKIAEAE